MRAMMANNAELSTIQLHEDGQKKTGVDGSCDQGRTCPTGVLWPQGYPGGSDNALKAASLAGLSARSGKHLAHPHIVLYVALFVCDRTMQCRAGLLEHADRGRLARDAGLQVLVCQEDE